MNELSRASCDVLESPGVFFLIFPEIYRFIAVGTSREVVQSNF